ncbi:MAG: M14 family zinc carboxypeptidase, partial [Bacteroidota bacterium]|nr:M14 family zinc carboxypeptidase [Bacteroidota bacterium]
MYKKLCCTLWVILFAFFVGQLNAQNTLSFDKYHNNSEVQQILKQLQQSNTSQTQLHTLATSPGGEPVTVLEIGKNSGNGPAIFVGANFEGNVPLATEGALRLAKMLLDSAQYTAKQKWYILPLPNPDAAKGYFSGAKYERSVNDFALNNDMDEATNEDGFEDLNGDGLITQMRVKDLTGTYLVSKNDPRIMVRAEAKKNERGEYKIYTEG